MPYITHAAVNVNFTVNKFWGENQVYKQNVPGKKKLILILIP